MTKKPPSQSQVVIVGGGVIGCSIAYHLAKEGVTDVTIVEQGKLTCGTSWHAAGLIMQLRPSHTLTQLCCYGARLLGSLKEETGQDTGFKQNGSLPIARQPERYHEIARLVSLGSRFGVEAHMLSPAEVKEHYPAARPKPGGRRRVHSGRRPGQPGRRHDGVRARGEERRCADRRGGQRHRLRNASGNGHGGEDRSGRHRLRNGGAVCWSVEPATWASWRA